MAFVTCPKCEGYGAICIAGIAGRWDASPYENDREEPCPECEGHGTVFDDSAEPLTLEDALMLDAEILRAKGVDVADPEFF